ncbi:MAG: hypothetical protein EOM08_01495 [Clostridia bacterium]|nr:hypothetical protein [Clostridia bacterium]NCC75090.1 hypothetical protein [Clostridia bacterium]
MRKYQQTLLSILLTVILLGLAYWAGRDQPVVDMKPVVRVIRDVAAGSQLTVADLAMVELPASTLMDNYFQELNLAVGQWTKEPLAEGEILISRKLSHQPSGIRYPNPGPGRRLMTIELAPGAANGFYLGPGTRIDLILVPRQDNNGLEMTQTIRNIEIVEVIGASEATSSFLPAASPSSALLCLDVSLQQAQQLSEAKTRTDIQIAVINEPPAGE